MIFPSNRVRIMVATKPVDFRKGHNGLAALVKNELRKDPFTGTVRLPVAQGGPAEAHLLGRHRYCDGLQAPGGKHIHLARHQGWLDDIEPCSVRSPVCGIGLRRVRSVETRVPEAIE